MENRACIIDVRSSTPLTNKGRRCDKLSRDASQVSTHHLTPNAIHHASHATERSATPSPATESQARRSSSNKYSQLEIFCSITRTRHASLFAHGPASLSFVPVLKTVWLQEIHVKLLTPRNSQSTTSIQKCGWRTRNPKLLKKRSVLRNSEYTLHIIFLHAHKSESSITNIMRIFSCQIANPAR